MMNKLMTNRLLSLLMFAMLSGCAEQNEKPIVEGAIQEIHLAANTGGQPSGLASLIFEGHELHDSLQTRQIDDSIRHLPAGVVPPGNPHLSTDPGFVEAISRSGSQGRLGSEGIRSVLYALYVGENEIGFYGLEAASVADANQREDALRKIWVKNVSLNRVRIHREGLVLLVIWTDGVSPECWEAVNASVVERLAAPGPPSIE